MNLGFLARNTEPNNCVFILSLSMGLCILVCHLVQRKQNSPIKVSRKGINISFHTFKTHFEKS